VATVLLNEEVCIGCGLCQVYCITEHSDSKDIIKAYKREAHRPLPRVRVERWGEDWLTVRCQHCEVPWCVYGCLTGAMTKDPETGIVSVDAEKCIGCGTCLLACPYGALSRDKDDQVVVKCDRCPDREIPVCVANCPNEALVLVMEEKTAAGAA
jgi:carbon-monoxide dehydrogenase iron sulfur subunit